jgi:ribosomal protein L12E/L44/L45/RPP1/RPP2
MASVPTAKKHPGGGYPRFNFPSYLRSMSKTKDSRARLKETARELGMLTHTSIRYQKEDSLYRIGLLCQRDPEFASHLMANTSLTREHLKLLTDGKLSDKEMKSIIEGAGSIRSTMAAPKDLGGGLASFIKEDEPEAKEEVKNDEPEEDKGPHQANLFDF